MKALLDSRLQINLEVVTNGEDAMDYVYQRGEFVEATRPDMILLDLNLPGKDGREVLAEIKGDDSVKRIPLVVLTSSEADKDIVQSYDLGANCYVKKPVNFSSFQDIIHSLEDFWFTVVRLPNKVD